MCHVLSCSSSIVYHHCTICHNISWYRMDLLHVKKLYTMQLLVFHKYVFIFNDLYLFIYFMWLKQCHKPSPSHYHTWVVIYHQKCGWFMTSWHRYPHLAPVRAPRALPPWPSPELRDRAPTWEWKGT